jgi:tetratricopeptide (TPR) repeat protein
MHSNLVAALATAYAGDVEAASAINVAVSAEAGITQHAEWEYTAGELASIDGRYGDAERHYRRAIELASDVGSTFVVGIASLGLLTVLRATGSTRDTLNGYREVLEYWRHAGNWIQAWTTMRNLADVLADLDDTETARTLLAAADRDADAPAVGNSAWAHPAVDPPVDASVLAGVDTREDAMDLALTAIDRQLQSSVGPDDGPE